MGLLMGKFCDDPSWNGTRWVPLNRDNQKSYWGRICMNPPKYEIDGLRVCGVHRNLMIRRRQADISAQVTNAHLEIVSIRQTMQKLRHIVALACLDLLVTRGEPYLLAARDRALEWVDEKRALEESLREAETALLVAVQEAEDHPDYPIDFSHRNLGSLLRQAYNEYERILKERQRETVE